MSVKHPKDEVIEALLASPHKENFKTILKEINSKDIKSLDELMKLLLGNEYSKTCPKPRDANPDSYNNCLNSVPADGIINKENLKNFFAFFSTLSNFDINRNRINRFVTEDSTGPASEKVSIVHNSAIAVRNGLNTIAIKKNEEHDSLDGVFTKKNIKVNAERFFDSKLGKRDEFSGFKNLFCPTSNIETLFDKIILDNEANPRKLGVVYNYLSDHCPIIVTIGGEHWVSLNIFGDKGAFTTAWKFDDMQTAQLIKNGELSLDGLKPLGKNSEAIESQLLGINEIKKEVKFIKQPQETRRRYNKNILNNSIGLSQEDYIRRHGIIKFGNKESQQRLLIGGGNNKEDSIIEFVTPSMIKNNNNELEFRDLKLWEFIKKCLEHSKIQGVCLQEIGTESLFDIKMQEYINSNKGKIKTDKEERTDEAKDRASYDSHEGSTKEEDIYCITLTKTTPTPKHPVVSAHLPDCAFPHPFKGTKFLKVLGKTCNGNVKDKIFIGDLNAWPDDSEKAKSEGINKDFRGYKLFFEYFEKIFNDKDLLLKLKNRMETLFSESSISAAGGGKKRTRKNKRRKQNTRRNKKRKQNTRRNKKKRKRTRYSR